MKAATVSVLCSLPYRYGIPIGRVLTKVWPSFREL